MIDILRQIIGLPADYGNYYSTLVYASCTIVIIFTLLISLGLYRLWRFIIKY